MRAFLQHFGQREAPARARLHRFRSRLFNSLALFRYPRQSAHHRPQQHRASSDWPRHDAAPRHWRHRRLRRFRAQLAAIGIGRLLEACAPPALAALAGPVAGLALGLVAAFVVVFGRIPAIVATLGLLGVYRAGIFLALGGSWLSGLPVGLTNLLAARISFGVPVSQLVIALAYAAVFVAVRPTPFGAHLLAIGHSEARARLAGIGVCRVQVAAFVISGGLCGLAASFYDATYRNVEMTIGATLALEAGAAVVLGGTAVTCGRISLLGTAFGVILLRLLLERAAPRRGAVALATRVDGPPSIARAWKGGLIWAGCRSNGFVYRRLARPGGQERDDASRLPNPRDLSACFGLSSSAASRF